MIPSRATIIEAQAALIEGLPHGASEGPSKACWACGLETATLHRAHIIARVNGGSDEPTNFLLLCYWCHREQPDGLDQAAQVSWLLARPHWTEAFLDRFESTIHEVIAECSSDGDAVGRLQLAPWREWVHELAGFAGASSAATIEANIRHGLASKVREFLR